MKYEYGGTDFNVKILDDGTLDTLIAVNGRIFRFDSEHARTIENEIREEAICEAIEAYLEERTESKTN